MNTNGRKTTFKILDGNEAAASVAYRLNELIAIYPITPSSPMAEYCDEWAAAGKKNLWGEIPRIVEMQSEGGAAGAVHGGLLGGALTTTFTASQGLLLMVPNLYKIAGELLPLTIHVSARALAAQGLSIFGDQADVMACRATGCALLCSNSTQEAHDFALIAIAASYRSRVPFIHFFDGFRTSHEVQKITTISDDEIRAVIDEKDIAAFRARMMTPDKPTLRGTAQNPDVNFQGREAVNRFYDALPTIVQETMDRFAAVTGRAYKLFDYHGHPEAERVAIAMGSGVETLCETADWLAAKGEKVGVIAVRLFLPFHVKSFMAALPKTVKAIAVLDRTKEPGALGEPLYQTVITALAEARSELAGSPRVVGGRYGLGSKEFTPAMVRAVFENLSRWEPKNHFTVGIIDDVTGTSLPFDAEWDIEADDVRRCVFVGLGADGTVGANKNSIKIIGEQTDFYAQGYFVYDSKKSGSVTTSHLRFGPRPVHAPYLIRQGGFVACSQFSFVGRTEVLGYAKPGATVLLNSPYSPEQTWKVLPREWQSTLISKKLRLFVIDATKVAHDSGMGRRTNTVLQTCFFALSGVLPQDEAIAHIKKAITKTYGRKGEKVVQMNHAAVDAALAGLFEVKIPAAPETEAVATVPPAYADAPEFVRQVTAKLLANEGDLMPVSAIPLDGCWPTGTARFEKRNIALEIPVWDPAICIQCNKCAMVCPHAAIRPKFFDPAELAKAPEGFQSVPFKSTEFAGRHYTLQVAAEDCTGCSICVQVCPAKDKTNPKHKAIDMTPQAPLLAKARRDWDFFTKLPDPDRTKIDVSTVKNAQFLTPLFEFSGACAGCGETPYIKLITQLFGDRMVVGNATGCSSIYGGNLPTTPYCSDHHGRGPTWANSLFEDNAEFGLGLHLAVEQRARTAKEMLNRLAPKLDAGLVQSLLSADQSNEAGIAAQRERVAQLKDALRAMDSFEAKRLAFLADDLVKKCTWIFGGDGWAYDIGYGGLDHVLASGANVKVLVLDTEVYSNTGGQSSKATPMGAVAKFAASGKAIAKKDLALIAMQYGHVYVARVAFGAKDSQTLQAIREAEAYNGPALIIAYSHCIAHGFPLEHGLEQQKLAVDTGYWPLFRYDPRLAAKGEVPLKLDSPAPKTELAKFMANETRFGILRNVAPARAEELATQAQAQVRQHYALYQHLASPAHTNGNGHAPAAAVPAPKPVTPPKPSAS
ncbi:pyruvate:ferredoxin (flavodoxin) oxidoreductase [Opitutus terrae]|uniref:Pyruvate flavodoxin/ferredoxin oxidoreductase domain protein n=1 Tax=Opitutus terrae (strain DSM 11246 / JCM 15787 / PB90-1) TaxID=452637 RepID=B1ZTF0_OPITP|nr:pyruvate:ferredoxin (flavodoxin) oxidoreductase [Opitutus terrae]ACB73895.1 pyruvate flavodoxin/ferredoxin oxidoreductase domain protein [Opitutus terrae PB90-1]